MVNNYGWILTFLWLVCRVCFGVPLGNLQTYSEFETENVPFLQNQESKKTQIPNHHGSYPITTASKHRNTKKSDMPEKGQIKFMKTLLGKVKTLLHNDDTKKEKSHEKKIMAHKIPERINAVASDSNTNKLYGVLGNSKAENDGEKSVNVISIPLNALKKLTKSDRPVNDLSREKDPGDLEHMPKGTQVLLRPVSVRLANNMGENKAVTSLVPVVLQNQIPGAQPLRSYSVFPDGPKSDPYGIPRLPFIIEGHRDIVKHNRGEEGLFKDTKGDNGLYRDIGHIPGEIRYHHQPLEEQDIITRRPSLRHKNPVRYHHARYDSDDIDDDIDDEDDDDDEDEDEDDEDDEDNDNQFEYTNSPGMRAEEQQIAATRKRLYDMLPGNDPTYTSENRGLGLPTRPGMMPEAFLGNPMVQPGVGVNQRTLMPLLGEAMAGEHADNSNDRNVFMLGRQGTKQVFGDSGSDFQDTSMHSASMRVNSGGFTLGGSPAQALSPNEVSYMLQKPGLDQLSQKDKITRPSRHKTSGVLLKVNGHSIGDSKELRDHVMNGMVFKGKEKLIKSKGPMDVKVSKATDGLHSKVVDITSADKVSVLDAKSKIAKTP